jgi:hypothetical protein
VAEQFGAFSSRQILSSPPSSLLERVQHSKRSAEKQLRSLKSRSNWLTYSCLTFSSFATLISGVAAAIGPPFGEGPPAWKLTCGVVALFTASAGVLTGIQQGSHLADELAKASACSSRLSSLELSLSVLGREPMQVAKEYEEVLIQNPHLILHQAA